MKRGAASRRSRKKSSLNTKASVDVLTPEAAVDLVVLWFVLTQ